MTTTDDASTGARRVAFGAAVAGALSTIVCVTGVPHVDARAWTADCFRTRQLHPYGAEGADLARIRQQLARDYGTNPRWVSPEQDGADAVEMSVEQRGGGFRLARVRVERADAGGWLIMTASTCHD